ncbi:hypothetical protein [Nocardia rhizosphaerae]|uniref:DUF4190 domain-containing protein n=1 Tax=Nocardia rhizosphaerae TaxID=1691571 RepID=A0ABV8L5C7_9NOCA
MSKHEEPERPAVSYSLRDDTPADSTTADQKQPGRPGIAYDLPAEPDGGTRTRQPWSTAGFVLAVVALLFFPIIFGVIGVACGLYGRRRGEELGNWSALAALTALLAGLAIRVFFFDADLIPAQN